MFESCLEKQKKLKEHFSSCSNDESRYTKIIDLGKKLPALNPEFKIPDNLVHGCQSTMYLRSYLDGQKNVNFEAESDALISAGLAALLLNVYNGEKPEVILKCPPTYIEDLGLSSNLTPNRANGLYSIHLKMKQDALRLLVNINR